MSQMMGWSMPLTGPPPDEIPLPRAPLVLVIGQVRFPTLLAVRNQDRLGAFQELIRDQYPYLEREEIPALTSPPGAADGRIDSLLHWRFWDETRRWRATLNQEFFALESLVYSSRDDFLGRMEEIANAFFTVFKPSHSSRLGLRYIDQLAGVDATELPGLLKPEVLGALSALKGCAPEHLVTQLAVNAHPGRLVARWGVLPKGSTPDGAIVLPSTDSCWIIDLDVSVTEAARFNVSEIVQKSRLCAERIYAVFRWMVTERFLQRYGAA